MKTDPTTTKRDRKTVVAKPQAQKAWPLGEVDHAGTHFLKAPKRWDFNDQKCSEFTLRVARYVVSMLNANGGNLWVGAETSGTSKIVVSTQIVPQPELNANGLLSYLQEVIEPQPPLTITPHLSGMLRVTVARGTDGPYAVRLNGGRSYLIWDERYGKLRDMTHAELKARMCA